MYGNCYIHDMINKINLVCVCVGGGGGEGEEEGNRGQTTLGENQTLLSF
jgi:hypothetical protein